MLNKVASVRPRKLVEDGLERIGLPVLGALMCNNDLTLPERHLGLVQVGETKELDQRLEHLADAVETSVNIDEFLSLGRLTQINATASSVVLMPLGQRIALALNQAFSFFYPHMLASWQTAGAEIIPFSPLANEPPPENADSCWLPGGYPERHAGRIADAQCFLQRLRSFAQTRPVHGECGGYMVLGETLEDGAVMRIAWQAFSQ